MIAHDETYMMVRNLLGEEAYTRLVGLLPNDYFNLTNEQKRIAFRAVLHEINHEGLHDPVKLAEIIRKYTMVMQEGAVI